MNRKRYLLKMLIMAKQEEIDGFITPGTIYDWDSLVDVAIDYCGTVVPRVTRDEFAALRSMTIGDLFN